MTFPLIKNNIHVLSIFCAFFQFPNFAITYMIEKLIY